VVVDQRVMALIRVLEKAPNPFVQISIISIEDMTGGITDSALAFGSPFY